MPLGVFVVYGDPTLSSTLEASLKLALLLPLTEVHQLQKVKKALYVFLQVLCATSAPLVCQLDSQSFSVLLEILQQGITKSTEGNIQELACLALDSILAMYYKERKKRTPLALHIEAHLTTNQNVIPSIMSDLLNLALRCKSDNLLAISRPLLIGFLLMPQPLSEQLKTQLAIMHPPDTREQVLSACTKMLEEIKDSISPQNRETFLQLIVAVRPS